MAVRGFPCPDLKDYLAALERAGELRRVSVPVDPTLEISEIVTRTVRAGGPALLFEKPTRGEYRVAINLFGTHRRMAMALGIEDVNEIGARIGALIRPELPVGWSGIGDGLGRLMQLKSVPPKHVKSAPCQGVVYDSVDLNRLPGLQTWPDDGGIFHNFGLTHTRHPETGKRNLGLYRLHQHSPDTLGMHWQIHKDSTAHHAVAERLGQRLPVATPLSCDPVGSYDGIAPPPARIRGYPVSSLPLIKMLIPGMVDRALPEAGGFHNCLVVSIAKRCPKHAQKVMKTIWGAHLLSLTILIVVVDEDFGPRGYHEVAFRAFVNVDY